MSRYQNYTIKNNVFGSLSVPISSLSTSIQLKDGEGARFSANQVATLENIEDGVVKKREIVLITDVNGDVLTVTRKYAPCPANDEANSQSQSSFAFGSDDIISAYITKEHFTKIEDGFSNTNAEIDDILENGDYKLRTYAKTGLQIEVKGGPVLVGSAYYDFAGGTLTLTDNATNYVEIDQDGLLVSNTIDRGDKNTKISKVITSGGAITSIEDWRLGTVGGEIGGVNIHELTKKNSLVNNDELVISDSENIWNNKKISASDIADFMTVSTCILLVGGGGGGNKGDGYRGGGGGGGGQVVFDNDFIIRRGKHYKIHIGCGGGEGTDGGVSVFDCCVALGGGRAENCGGNGGGSNSVSSHPEGYIANYSIFVYGGHCGGAGGGSQYVGGSGGGGGACGDGGNGGGNSNCGIGGDGGCGFCSDIDGTSKAYGGGGGGGRRYECTGSHAGTVNGGGAGGCCNGGNATVYGGGGGGGNRNTGTGGCGCQGVFIIKYLKSCGLCITGAQCSYECNNNCIHIVTQDSIICAK